MAGGDCTGSPMNRSTRNSARPASPGFPSPPRGIGTDVFKRFKVRRRECRCNLPGMNRSHRVPPIEVTFSGPGTAKQSRPGKSSASARISSTSESGARWGSGENRANAPLRRSCRLRLENKTPQRFADHSTSLISFLCVIYWRRKNDLPTHRLCRPAAPTHAAAGFRSDALRRSTVSRFV